MKQCMLNKVQKASAAEGNVGWRTHKKTLYQDNKGWSSTLPQSITNLKVKSGKEEVLGREPKWGKTDGRTKHSFPLLQRRY